MVSTSPTPFQLLLKPQSPPAILVFYRSYNHSSLKKKRGIVLQEQRLQQRLFSLEPAFIFTPYRTFKVLES